MPRSYRHLDPAHRGAAGQEESHVHDASSADSRSLPGGVRGRLLHQHDLDGCAAFLLPTATVTLGYGDSSAVDPVFARTMSTLGDGFLLIAAPVALAASLALTCRVAHANAAMPGWAVYAGYAVALSLLLAGWTWFPLPLMVIWALVTGLRLLLGPDRTRTVDTSAADLDRTVTSPA